MMHRVFVFIIITLVIFDSFGYLLFNLMYDRLLKYEFLLKSVNENNFESISRISIQKYLEKDKLQFEEDNEFEYNGKMYDVLKVVETKDSIHYYCYYDTKETDYKQGFNSILANKLETNRKSLFQSLGRNLYSKLNAKFIANLPSNDSRLIFFDIPQKTLSNYIDIPSPPPRKLFS